MGDGQHGWAAAEWIQMIRNLFVREEGSRLIVGSGIFSEWIEKRQPIRFGPTLTPDGPLSIRMEKEKKGRLAVMLEADKENVSPGAEICVPGYLVQPALQYNRTYLLEAVEE